MCLGTIEVISLRLFRRSINAAPRAWVPVQMTSPAYGGLPFSRRVESIRVVRSGGLCVGFDLTNRRRDCCPNLAQIRISICEHFVRSTLGPFYGPVAILSEHQTGTPKVVTVQQHSRETTGLSQRFPSMPATPRDRALFGWPFDPGRSGGLAPTPHTCTVVISHRRVGMLPGHIVRRYGCHWPVSAGTRRRCRR